MNHNTCTTIRYCVSLVLGIAALAGVVGCAGSRGPAWPSPHDADVRVEAVLERWRSMRAAGGTCEGADRPDIPRVDCAAFRRELERLALDFPNHPRLLLARAVLAHETGRPARAQAFLDARLGRPGSHPEAAVLRARIAAEEGNLPFAARMLREQVELRPDHAGLREAAAAVAYLREELDEAERQLGAAERLGSPAWRVAYHRGLLAEARGDLVEARARYRTALRHRPDFGPARSRLVGLDLGVAAPSGGPLAPGP